MPLLRERERERERERACFHGRCGGYTLMVREKHIF